MAPADIDRVVFRVRHRIGHDVPAAEIIRRWTADQDNLARPAPLIANILLLDSPGMRTRVTARVAEQEVVRHAGPLSQWAVDLVARIEVDRAR